MARREPQPSEDTDDWVTDWDFVTCDDMMAEAANYEDWLNTR
jgi:hypothetical protein